MKRFLACAYLVMAGVSLFLGIGLAAIFGCLNMMAIYSVGAEILDRLSEQGRVARAADIDKRMRP